MGSLDLKREMEKLKQLDEEQKRQKKISLKINTHHQTNNSIDANHSKNHSQDSPTKRILLGEFDEEKDDDDDLYLGDDLLLSKENSKNVPFKIEGDEQIEVFDFSEYITQKMGIEDPFPDHQNPNEEGLTPSKKDN